MSPSTDFAIDPSTEDAVPDLVLRAQKCRYNNQFLLLLRDSKHNNNTWGLPGGNQEQLDPDLMQTALREGTEEMGSLPEFEVLTEIKTRSLPGSQALSKKQASPT